MEPLVSIGIPVKNGFTNKTEKDIDLEKTLNSILKQSYNNIEIIISNNAPWWVVLGDKVDKIQGIADRNKLLAAIIKGQNNSFT